MKLTYKEILAEEKAKLEELIELQKQNWCPRRSERMCHIREMILRCEYHIQQGEE